MLPPFPSPLRLELRSVCRRNDGNGAAVHDIALSFEPGSFNLLVGDASCSGLLRIAGLLDEPDSGEVLVDGETMRGLNDQARAELRSRLFGYLFSAPYLLPSMSILENVAMPLFKIAGASLDEARERTNEVLEFAGLGGAERENVGDLTWAEQQRVALARGLIHRPAFMIVEHADSGMSRDESARLVELLREVPTRFGAMVITVLFSPQSPAKSDRVLTCKDGVIQADSLHPLERESSSP